jgi:hypothetical protein
VIRTLLWAAAGALLVGCTTTTYTYPVVNAPGTPTTYQDPSTRGPVSGVGIEAQDIISMTDRMVRDMLGNPALAGAKTPPRVILDAEYFRNESASRLNVNSITDRLRVSLNRSSQGRMTFVARHFADMVAREREIKRQGVVDQGTTGLTRAQQGGDYRMGGRITSLDSRSAATGQIQRYNQITFEMVDLESGQIVWSGIYEFLKSAQDDVIYR